MFLNLFKIVSSVFMCIIFFLIVFPIGMSVKIFKRNFLGIKYDKNLKTYWINKSNLKKNMKDQF